MEGIIREISVTEAAGRLGISRQRVLRLIRNKLIRARRAANIYLIREPDLASVVAHKSGRSAKKTTNGSTRTKHVAPKARKR